ncbi:MAG TPA: 4-hydroxythreonine-4-phosphate dehydrogenase PdxA [Thermodesulfobacteriota bacterium]|nr:4-hydroxythreonine-4-phosphate dehydrogenase PdxA [Thermodesulfobacteriota bacterium]
MQDVYKPTVGITMGDPNGIGPEIILKALCCAEVQSICRPIVYGSKDVLDKAKDIVAMDAVYQMEQCGDFALDNLNPGKVSKESGEISLVCIETAVTHIKESKIDFIVTAPITKEAIHLAGSKFPGHTEMLAELSGADHFAMMFEGDKFKVVLATIHEALKDVPGILNKDDLFYKLVMANDALKNYFGIERPRIVVCGLNPHAGEAGAFGTEEQDIIIPAIDRARLSGMDIEGPLPADTLFYHAAGGRWDIVVAMYHDQGLIPFKMLNFEKGVNVTIGLPFIRTSPDHGTAFDIAWKGEANPSSMIQAIKVAVNMYLNSRHQ